MLPSDVTFDTGEETERGRKRKKTSLKIIIVVRYNRGTVGKSRDNTEFQEIGFFEYCFESKKFLIFLEKVYAFRSLRFCGTDFHRSIASNEIICLSFTESLLMLSNLSFRLWLTRNKLTLWRRIPLLFLQKFKQKPTHIFWKVICCSVFDNWFFFKCWPVYWLFFF